MLKFYKYFQSTAQSANVFSSSFQISDFSSLIVMTLFVFTHLSSHTCLSFPALSLLLFLCGSPVVLPSVCKGFGLTDTQQDYHHSTQETTHLSLQLSIPRLHPPHPIHPSTHLSIHRLPLFLDSCYPTPGPAQVSLPFPPLSCVCVCVCVCARAHTHSLTSVFPSVFLSECHI